MAWSTTSQYLDLTKSMGSLECQKVEHFATNAKNIIEKSKHGYFRAIVFWCFLQFQFYIYGMFTHCSSIIYYMFTLQIGQNPRIKDQKSKCGKFQNFTLANYVIKSLDTFSKRFLYKTNLQSSHFSSNSTGVS